MENNELIDYKTAKKILEVKDLRVNFKSDSGMVYAVRGVSFDLYKGETLCIVGESGSGKSVTSKTIMGILPGNAIVSSGQILYDGEDLVRVSEDEFHRIRGHEIGMIFQDPLSSLNPIMKVGKQIIEATMINKNVLKKRYNDLIAKELVTYRNEESNLKYEQKKNKEEISKLKDFIKRLDKAVKNDIKNVTSEESDKISKEINNYFVNLVSLTQSEIEDLDKTIEQIKVSPINEDIKVNINIKDIRIQNILKRIEFLKPTLDIVYTEENARQLIKDRIATIKNIEKETKHDYAYLKPLLKRALAQSKKIAASDNKVYYKELVNKKNATLKDLNIKLSEIKSKIDAYIPSLSSEEKEKYDKMIYQKAHKSKDKNNGLTGIARASIVDDTVKETGNKEFDELLLAKENVEKEIEKTKTDFVNKTKITKSEAKKLALNVMREVGIPLPEKRFKQYPFEFSGGMRQRIVIAIALTANPDILICDEPTTALDVTIQAQILELINKLKKERGLSCIFITHDLGVVANMADRVAVMYAGKIVEYGTSYEIFFEPKHPYTWALLSSIPDIDSKEKLESIPGTPPDMRFPIEGDAFAFRSKYAMAIDFKSEPPYFKVSDTHYAATWLLHPKATKVEMPKIVKTRIENALKGGKKDGK